MIILTTVVIFKYDNIYFIIFKIYKFIFAMIQSF
jgi:hypothetical protein